MKLLSLTKRLFRWEFEPKFEAREGATSAAVRREGRVSCATKEPTIERLTTKEAGKTFPVVGRRASAGGMATAGGAVDPFYTVKNQVELSLAGACSSNR